jgi:hypothetical protein
MFGRRDSDDPVMSQRTRVRGILALVSSTSGNKRMKFVNREFNVTIRIRRSAVLNTGTEDPGRFNFMGQPLRLDLYPDNSKSIADGRSRKSWETSV